MRVENKSLFNKAGKPSAYKIENKAEESTVYIYDEIGMWGIEAQVFVKDFNAIDSKTIHLRVNSPGGSVFDGTTIYNVIKQHKSKVIAHVDGLAASIASVIVLAADEVQMADNAFYMIHEPWSIMAGGADELRKEADLLDKVRGTIAKTYMDKSGKDEEEIFALMKEETWMTAEEALENGFIDSIYSVDAENKKDILFDLTVFNNVPDKLKKAKKELTASDIEEALTNAGCPQGMAKSIIAKGFRSEQREVADTESQTQEIEQREVAVKPDVPIKNFVSDLLIRAEMVAPSK